MSTTLYDQTDMPAPGGERMAAVTVYEFSQDPGAVLARAEHGEVIEVTRGGEVIAILTPRPRSHYETLVAEGLIIPAKRGLTTSDLEKYTRIEVPDDVDPLAILLQMRAEER
jgi:antitoxin (DNA-binding transcriptional repressor) of toxin-antitoxin stability system